MTTMLSNRVLSVVPVNLFKTCISNSMRTFFAPRISTSVVNCRYSSSFREKKRFYKRAGIEQADDGFQVTVDNRKVKTPHGSPLVVSNKQLAMAVAAEWNMQKEFIKPSNMNLTGLANTVIDKPNPRSKEQQIQDILEFLCTDTICFPATEPDDLVNLQKREWNPLVDWFNQKFDVSVTVVDDLLVQTIQKDTLAKLRTYLSSINDWAMTGLEFAVETSKSFIITTALLDNHVSVEKAAYLSRLELEFQIGRWGSVEWAHDVDLMELRSRLASAVLFYHLSSE